VREVGWDGLIGILGHHSSPAVSLNQEKRHIAIHVPNDALQYGVNHINKIVNPSR
jgi:hypothetical protein